jgi:hypothetical protein
VTAGKLFLLVGGTAPKPLFAEFHSAAAHRSGTFFPAPGGGFLKTARLAYQHNRKLSRDRKRHFQNPSGSQSRSQRETLFKGLGMLPNKQNLRFPASPETAVLSVCIYRRPACHFGGSSKKGKDDRPLQNPSLNYNGRKSD